MDGDYYLPAEVKKITLEQVQELITNQQREDSVLDYKRNVPRDLERIACSLLNARGAHNFWDYRKR